MDPVKEPMDTIKEPKRQSLPAEFKEVDDCFDIFLTLRHLGVHFDPDRFPLEVWGLHPGGITHGEQHWVGLELSNTAAARLLCHTNGKQNDSQVSESIRKLRSSLEKIGVGREAGIKSPALRQYLAQRRAEMQTDIDALTAYSSLDPLPAYSVLDSKPACTASDPAADRCVLCQGKETPLAPSWEYLRKSAATVVTAITLAGYKDSNKVICPSNGAGYIWSVHMLNALYLRCHPFAGLEKRLKDCPVFTEDLLRSLRRFALFSIYKHMSDLISIQGVVTKLSRPQVVREWTDAQMWLHNLDAGNSKDAPIMKKHGIEFKTIKAALFDPYKTDGVEEEALGRGASPFVQARLAAMEGKMATIEARMAEIRERL